MKQSLDLRAREYKGQALDAAWSWPDGEQVVPLHFVLQSMGLGEHQDLSAMQFCKLQRLGSAAQPIWVLGNSSRELMCSVNGRTLSAGQQVRLEQGDLIEIGLTRFEVFFHGHDPAQRGDANKPLASAAADWDDTFDLTSLALPTDAAAALPRRPDDKKRSDFSDLISLEPVAVPEVLAARSADSMATSDATMTASMTATTGTIEAQTALVTDPLAALHAQYLRKLRDPSATDEDVWVGLALDIAQSVQDPMQSLMHSAGNRTSLDDLLGQTQSIHSVLDGLNAVGDQDLMAPIGFDSVMHLFAPDNLRLPEGESLESMVQRSLPDLTRREHHSLSVDSAMPESGAPLLKSP